MNKETFSHYATSYGAHLKNWPEEVRSEAQQALNEHAQWQTILDNEQGLDDMLDHYQPNLYPPNTGDYAALEAAILAETVRKVSLLDNLLSWLQPDRSIWRPALAACLPILVGITLGANLELEDQYVLAEELELLNGTYWLESELEVSDDEV